MLVWLFETRWKFLYFAASLHQLYFRSKLLRTFSYIVAFRGGIYCSQVESNDLKKSLQSWLKKITEQKSEIKFLGDGTLKEIASIINQEDYQPVLLQGLRNIWFMQVPTSKGALYINIVMTDVS